MTRLQFPVVAGFAMTVNKAQGLTIKEGVVIQLLGGRRFRPNAKHGLPFVAFTRSESFAMTAFKNLPPWNDFIKGEKRGTLLGFYVSDAQGVYSAPGAVAPPNSRHALELGDAR